MVSFRGQKKRGPRPDRSPLGVKFKISNEHPHAFHMRSAPPPRARYNEPRCNEVLRITDGCSYPSNSEIYELKEPRYNETSSKRTYFVYGLLILPILWPLVTSKFY